VHPGEVVEEKISLSERFGLWVSFYPFTPGRVPGHRGAVAAHFGVTEAAIAAARQEALVWALERGSRSGRVAYQFARDYDHAVTTPRRRAAGDRPRSGHRATWVTDVAVGVLIERDAAGPEGRFLLTSRPEGKVYAGYWEFPGGKLEAGETRRAGLRRELHEELGITIGAAQPWQQEMFDYPHARVRLHFCKVYDWQGAFEMREAPADGLADAAGAGGAGAAGHAAGAALVCRRARLQRADALTH
jgi:mutator protein MutT